MADIFYIKEPDTHLFKRAGQTAPVSGSYQLLLGGRIHVDLTTLDSGWARAETVPNSKGKSRKGFIELERLSTTQILKVFYLDVGQGDCTMIEAEGAVVVIDGGPSRGFSDRLIERLESLRRADQAIGLPPRPTFQINAVIISHFDLDHYNGLTRALKNSNFTFGKIYHNGLPRYSDADDKDLNLGTTSTLADGSQAITTDLSDLDSGLQMIADGKFLTDSGNLNQFGKFLKAAEVAQNDGRLGGFERLVRRDVAGPSLILPSTGDDLKFEVLGPISTTKTGRIKLPAFHDPHKVTARTPHPSPTESHTINGNSIVLKLVYGANTFLFGGDLNEPAQKYLEDKYGNLNKFKSDVNKACHHGSSDFHIGYVKAIKPHATVFSSGDNGSYDHPLPDAMGTAAKHSRGNYPLVFSTELARETGSRGIKFGHINARSNGEIVVMAQKKEKPSSKQSWYTFGLPYKGPFH